MLRALSPLMHKHIGRIRLFPKIACDGFTVNPRLGSFRHRFVIGAAEAQERLGPNQTTKPKLWQVLSVQGEPT
jgi:hypothetical protein